MNLLPPLPKRFAWGEGEENPPSPVKTCVAFLRAVNVAGRNRIAMTELCAMAGEIGFAGAKSYLQSGNLILRSARGSAAAVEQSLERETERRLGLATSFMVRTADQLDAAIAANPFPDQARREPGRLVLLLTKERPTAQAVSALRSAVVGREMVESAAGEIFIVYPDGIGRSKLTSNVIERHLGTRATARNWNTVTRLAALARG